MSEEILHEASAPEDRSFRLGLQSRDVVPVIAAVSGLAAIFTGQQPTGNLAADVVLTAVFAALIPWLAQHARYQLLLASAALALFFSGFRLPSLVFGVVAVGLALAITAGWRVDRDTEKIAASFIGAATVHAALHFADIGFSTSASLLAAIAVAPVAVSGFLHLPDAHRRRTTIALMVAAGYAILASVLAVVAALTVRSQVEVGIEQAEDGVTAIEQGDRPLALSQLEAARENFDHAGARLGGPLAWPARLVPIAAQHSRALETAAAQGEALATTAARTVTQADVEKIRGQNGAIDLTIVDAVNAELSLANRTLAAAQQSLRDVNTPWLLPLLSSRLVSVDEELVAAAADIDLANHATTVLPQILGATSQRRYLVLFVQPAEAREFGGFVGAYGILEVDNGRFNLAESGSIDVDLGLGEASFTDPESLPEPFVRIAPQINPQNLTAVADLSTIASAARDLVPQWRENPSFLIDGVITVDPYALAGMLELTGPLAIEGRDEPIDSTNVVDFLLRDQYIEFEAAARDTRQDLLKSLAGQAFAELLRIDVPGPERLGAIFGPAARADRLAMVTFDDFENAFLDRIFLSADLPEVGSAVDMLGVYVQTGTASKLDGYTRRTIDYDVTVDPATGEVIGELTVTDFNEAPADAGPFVLGNTDSTAPDGTALELGDNLVALGLYTRAEVENLTSDQLFLLQTALPAFSYTRHAITHVVPLGGSSTVTATLRAEVLPGRYDLLVPAQATANPVEFTLTVRPAPGWRVVGANDGAIYTDTLVLDEVRAFTFGFEPVG